MDVFQKFISNDYIETENIGKNFAKNLKAKDCIAFIGGLGVGKTAFVRGLANGLNVSGEVCSPTYAIVHEYQGIVPLVHFDMYRIHSLEDLESTGYFDYLDNMAILAIEWSENISSYLPKETIYVSLKVIDENTREIIIESKDN